MQKIDLKKQWKHLYAPSVKEIELVDVPTLLFAMIDGTIKPGEMPGESQEFQEAVGTLYGISYTLKFLSKRRKDNPIDYTVMALEGLWWTASGEFDLNRPGDWQWTLMIMQPEHITEEMFREVLGQFKRKRDSPALSKLRLERFHEGLCIQIVHVGPYATEPATVEKMKVFAQEHGYRYCGKHHEIYLGDPRRVSPEKLRTILRQPVAKTQ